MCSSFPRSPVSTRSVVTPVLHPSGPNLSVASLRIRKPAPKSRSQTSRCQQREEQTDAGVLTIRPLKTEDIPEIADIIVESFREVLGYARTLEWYLNKEVTWYLEDCLNLGVGGFVFVASLEPTEGWKEPKAKGNFTQPMFQTFSLKDTAAVSLIRRTTQNKNLAEKTTTEVFTSYRQQLDGKEPKTPRRLEANPEQDSPSEVRVSKENTEQAEESSSKLIGTIEVSLTKTTRAFCLLLNPPAEAAYICNMAVDPAFRRQGNATRLLKAAEDFARTSGKTEAYLHILVEDEVAEKLYKKFGYEVERTHPGLIRLLGQDQKHLMRKTLAK